MKSQQPIEGKRLFPFITKVSLLVRLLLIVFFLGQIHCTPLPPPEPTPNQVSAILRAFKEVIRVSQQGQLVSHYTGMELYSRDQIETYSGGWAHLYFPATGIIELFASNTPTCRVRILSPSIFIEIGVVRGDVTNNFEFQTKFLISNTSNAKFTVFVSPDNTVFIEVLRGSVTVKPRSRAWAPVTVMQYQEIVVKGDQREAPIILEPK